MIRTNLSTRPFYNERPLHVVLAVAAVFVLAVTALNVSRVFSLSARQTALSRQAAADEARAVELARETGALRRQLDARALEAVTVAAQEANVLIDRRTFSWTTLFNHLEATLPPGVMLTSIRPDTRDDEVWIAMVVIVQHLDDIEGFIERLEATGAFEGVLSRQEEAQVEGTYRASLSGRYRPSPPDAGTTADSMARR